MENSIEDYNNQGIDVILPEEKEIGEDILIYTKNEIQNNSNLIEATRKAEKIGNSTNKIIEASKNLKEKNKNKEKIFPKHIDAKSIKNAILNDDRTNINNNFDNNLFYQEIQEENNGVYGKNYNNEKNIDSKNDIDIL